MPFFEFGEVYPPTWPNKPPGLLERDFIIWDMYRKEHFPEFEKFYYNVPITLATLPTEGLSKEMIRQAYFSSARRIDVVGVRKNGDIWLIEVTSYASVRAIGQAITYFYIWSKLKPLPGPFMAVILGQFFSYDIKEVAKAYNITLIEVQSF